MSMSVNKRLSLPQSRRVGFGPILNTAIVAGGYLLSRVLGLGRDVIISARFGTASELDAYRAAFGILDLIYLVVAGGALGSAFIPVFAGLLAEHREDDAWRLASAVLRWALLGLLVACGLIALLAGPLVAATVGSGFDPVKQALTAQILRLLLIQPVLLGLGGLAKATLESFDRFSLPAIGSNLYNVGIIGGALLAPWLGIDGLVWGVIAGAALFLLVQLPGLRGVGARYLPLKTPNYPDTTTPRNVFDLRAFMSWWLDTPGLGRVGRLLAPRLFGQSAWQINMIAIASFASLLGTGAVAANGYALQLMLLPHGLVALSLGTVVFPRLARHYAAGEIQALRAVAVEALRGVLFLALPAAALLAALGLPLVRLLYQRGAFDALSAALTARALGFYALGLAAFAASEILVRAFYAMQDTRTPVYVGVGAVLLNIGLGWALLRSRPDLGTLALAFSVANTAEALALLWLLGSRLGGLGAGFARGLLAMLLAALAMAGALLGLLWLSAPSLPFLQPGDSYHWPSDFLPLVLWLSVAGPVGALAYGVVAALLRLPEIGAVLGRLGRVGTRFGLRRQPTSEKSDGKRPGA
jgi:putative peptidoglycan lipid II flippase